MARTKQASLVADRVESVLQLLTLAAMQLPDDFSGLGVIFYDSLTDLPFLPLDVSRGGETLELPVSGLDPVCDLLVRTARTSSQWHDGFHFVHASSLTLTHICQFVAPPIPDDSAEVPRASGARHMTALLASRINGILAIGLLTQGKVISIYESGKRTLRTPKRCYP